MKQVGPQLAALAAAGSLIVSGCASDLAQGYRSTPEYPEYADARDGYNDGLECGATFAGMLGALWIASDFESRTGYRTDSGNPTGEDWLGGLIMSLVFAFAEDRPYTLSDACAGAAVASASNRRLRD